jgi:hypothetical protein
MPTVIERTTYQSVNAPSTLRAWVRCPDCGATTEPQFCGQGEEWARATAVLRALDAGWQERNTKLNRSQTLVEHICPACVAKGPCEAHRHAGGA